LGTTRAGLASVNGVLDRLGPDTAFVKVRNVWAMPVLPGDPGYEPGKYVAFYELPADKTLPPDGLLIVHAEALSPDLEADGMSEIFNLSESRTDTLASLQANYAVLNMAAFLQQVQLKITGAFSLGAIADLTAGVTGTVYESSNPAVVTVTADGTVIAMGNGDADLTITNSTFVITIPVHVDFDLFLTELRIVPVPELDRVGAEGKLRTLGVLQDGATVDLTAAFTGIYYTSADPAILTVDSDGALKGTGVGETDVTASFSALVGDTMTQFGDTLRVKVLDGVPHIAGWPTHRFVDGWVQRFPIFRLLMG
jgi:large repetitive protein